MITKARSTLVAARSSEKYMLGISPECVNTPMLESAFSERVDSKLSVIIGAPKSVILFGLGEISILSVVPSIYVPNDSSGSSKKSVAGMYERRKSPKIKHTVRLDIESSLRKMVLSIWVG